MKGFNTWYYNQNEEKYFFIIDIKETNKDGVIKQYSGWVKDASKKYLFFYKYGFTHPIKLNYIIEKTPNLNFQEKTCMIANVFGDHDRIWQG